MPLIVLAAVLALLATPAYGEPCSSMAEMMLNLGSVYNERQVAAGSDEYGLNIYRLWLSSKGSWTITRTSPTGRTCVVFGGWHWRELKSKPPMSPLEGPR